MNNVMNWPLDKDWKCWLCESPFRPQWGLAHGECVCECGAWYTMRKGTTILTTPIPLIKDEYKEVARHLWKEKQTNISDLDAVDWIDGFKSLGLPVPKDLISR